MTPRAAFIQLGKLVAAELSQGGRSGEARSIGEAPAALPGSSLVLLDLIISETGKKKPNDALFSAYLIMLGVMLEERRHLIERHHAEAGAEVAALRVQLLAAGKAGRLQLGVLMLLLRQLLSARLELGMTFRR